MRRTKDTFIPRDEAQKALGLTAPEIDQLVADGLIERRANGYNLADVNGLARLRIGKE